MNNKVLKIILVGFFILFLTGCEDGLKNNKNDNTNSKLNEKYIGIEKAKEIALNDVGINVSQVRELSIELERTMGKVTYDVDFKYNGKEYDYDIDALTGEILNKKVEIDD